MMTFLPKGDAMTLPTKTDFANLAERTGWTFAEAFLAVFVVTDTSTVRSAVVAAAAAALVPVKGFVKSWRAKADGVEPF